MFLSILGLSLFKQEGREDLKIAKVKKKTNLNSLFDDFGFEEKP